MANLDGTTSDEVRTAFIGLYSVLKLELLNDPAFEWTNDSRQWVERMLDYNVPGGKLNRGLSVIDSYKLLKEGKDLAEGELLLASVLGWSIEWLQAYFLVLDDIMDNSHTRRGQACWYRAPKVEFQTAAGQMIDLITTVEGEKDLSKYSLHLHNRIAEYKSAYYSFYLPVACALLIAGEDLDNHVNMKDVLIDMGIYFQVLDDYLDCFGDPEKIGKIGTDIEDFKCSWLVVKALELCNEEQKKILFEHYGKADPANVAKVKAVYSDINLQSIFFAYKSETYNKLRSAVEAHPNKAVQAIWARYTRGRS